MQQLTRRTLLAGCGALLAGCTAPAGSDDRTATPAPATSLADAPLDERWSADLPGQYTLSRPAAGTHLYIASRQGLFAIDRADGSHAWTADLGALSHGFSPVVAAGTVLAGARDLVDGRRPVDRGGTPALTAVSEAGERLWRVECPLGATPAIAGDTVLVPETDEEGAAVRALALETGAERWHRRLDAAEAYTRPAADADGGYLTVRDGDRSHLLSLALDGTVRWRRSLDGRSHQGPAVHDGRVAVGTDSGVVAVFGTDGADRWQTRLDGPVYTTPALAGDRTYAATGDGVTAFDAAGERRWRGVVDDIGKTGVTVADGVVHLGGNEVAGFDAESGDPQWRIELPGLAGTFGAPIVVDGTVYTGACIKTDGNDRYDHAVYALA